MGMTSTVLGLQVGSSYVTMSLKSLDYYIPETPKPVDGRGSIKEPDSTGLEK